MIKCGLRILIGLLGALVLTSLARTYDSRVRNQEQNPVSNSATQVDWKARLAAIEKELASNPNSAFLHNQAAVAYAALSDFNAFDREIHAAMRLDPGNSNNFYVAYAVYKRNGMGEKAAAALNQGIKVDPKNPFGHYERAGIYESEKKWSDALDEYKTTQKVLKDVQLDQNNLRDQNWIYTDIRGNPFDVTWEVAHISEDLRRVQNKVDK